MSSINSNSGHFDNLNSSIVPLDAGDTFVGVFSSCLNFAVIDVSVKCDSEYLLKINYSHNGISEDFTDSVSVSSVSADTLFYEFRPKMRYYQIKIENTDSINQTVLTLQTLLKSTVTYQVGGNTPSSNVTIVNPLNLDGSVFVGGNLALTGSVDANITNTSLDVNVTNPVTSVDANITNTSLDVNVTNPVTSVDANITNASLDVNVTNPVTSVDANITNASLDVSDGDTHAKLDTIQTQLEKSNKGTSTLWSNNVTGVNGVSLILNLSNVNQSNLTIFGSVDGATNLVVQFSNDGTNFYDSQYSYVQSASGNWGFNITACPLYLRLKSTSNVTAYAFVNYS